MSQPWTELSVENRKTHILRLLNATDVSDYDKRMKTVRSILYLCQGLSHVYLWLQALNWSVSWNTFFVLLGCFAECSTGDQQMQWARDNVFLLYECGTFSTFCELLSMEIEWVILKIFCTHPILLQDQYIFPFFYQKWHCCLSCT